MPLPSIPCCGQGSAAAPLAYADQRSVQEQSLPLFNVSSNEAGWQAAIHVVVHRLGRHFGFQAFNLDPRSENKEVPVYIPATIFLVTDHLYHLLVKNYMRRDKASGTDEDRWVRAVYRLHATIFQGYRDWCRHVELPERVEPLTLGALRAGGAVEEWEYLLEELALYFLMYSEGANLRHVPEALWFLYWCLRNSRERMLEVTSPPPTNPCSAAYTARAPPPSLVATRIRLRNEHQKLIADLRQQQGVRDGDMYDLQRRAAIHSAARAAVLGAGLFEAGQQREVNMLAEMVAYGDSGAFLDKLVSPIFAFLAIEVDKKGTSKVEIAARVTYDDVNESLCMPDVVHKTLVRLGVQWDQKTRRLKEPPDLYAALMAVGTTSVVVGDSKGAAVAPANGGGQPLRPFTLAGARDWWRDLVFGKTFVERRSLLTMYRAFYRIWAFLILEFHFMAVMLWGYKNWYALSSVALNHAFLSLLEQVAGAWTQRGVRLPEEPPQPGSSSEAAAAAKGKHVKVLGRSVWNRCSRGILDWLLINLVLYLALAAQATGFIESIFWVVTISYTGLVVFHAVITTRDGYCISLSNVAAAKLRRWRRDPCSCCGGGWTPLIWLLERIGASSARPVPQEYLAPYHMKVGWANWFSNAVFWVLVLGGKFAFDWFALMKPLKKPIEGLWQQDWLSAGDGDGDFILVIARCLPSFIVMLNDAQIFYYVGMAAFGVVKGVIQLNLGTITNFQEIVVSFHKAPKRWWESCMSEQGKQNLHSAIDGLASGTGTVPRKGNTGYTMPGVHVTDEALHAAMPNRRVLDRQRLSYTERLLQNTQHAMKQSEEKKVLAYFEDNRVAMWLVFSDVWNAVVEELRSIDLISNPERDNLLFVHLDIDQSIEVLEGMRPFMLPIFFYGGQISKAMESPSLNAAQQVALTEIRSLLTWLLMQLGVISREEADVMLHFTPLARPATLDHRHCRTQGVDEVVKLLKALQSLQGKAPDEAAQRNRQATLMGLRGNLNRLCDILLKETQAVLVEYPRPPGAATQATAGQKMHKSAAEFEQVVRALKDERLVADSWEAFVARPHSPQALFSEAPSTPRKRCMATVIKQVTKMLETSAQGAQPRGEEAQRVLSVFAGSLKNPTLEKPPSIEEMLSWNTLTPHYEEDVIYALNAASVAKHFGMDAAAARGMQDLMRENDDGVSVMQWLRSAYPAEWNNLLERLKPLLNGLDPRYVTDADFDVGGPLNHIQMELLLWASYRGQLLARTVRGMMAYEKAIRLLAHLECPQPPGMSDSQYLGLVDDVCRSKFTYVVASQVYAANRYSSTPKGRWLARGIDVLLHQFRSLRVAFIDTFSGAGGKQQYSVLIRSREGRNASDPDGTQELYRVRLPRNTETGHGVVLGEGKPENQNAAIIFCFGEVVQAIDMNQDNYLAEAVKMRNLINEFNPPAYNNDAAKAAERLAAARRPANGGRGSELPLTVSELGGDGVAHVRVGTKQLEPPWPPMGHKPVALVGFREWIFSQDSGALAGFAAATEFTFGSIVQRVMTWPGGVRFHYGHPDLWNKLFVMTRGGVSKATRGFHISEDVFAGYNHVQRGGNVKFKEYISVGKGRDMGFDSINSFESKVSGGNGEQVMSRDVHRLATQFDFFRLLSFYHSGCGFFINTYLVMLSVYVNIWVILLMALTTDSYMVKVPWGPDGDYDEINVLTGQTSSVSIQQVVQLGMFSIITYAVELALEYGFFHMIATIVMQIIQGSLSFFIFRSRTTAYYFASDVRYGGAKYIPTGRGYAIKHNSFVKVYSSYARSHMYYAAELLFLAIMLPLIDTTSYAGISWSTWMVAIGILWAPFWFNPQTFQLERCKDDFQAWRLWMKDVTDTSTNSTWYSWNKSQLDKPRNEERLQTSPLATALGGVVGAVPTALLVVASITKLEDTKDNPWVVFGVLSGIFWVFVLLVAVVRHHLLKHSKHRMWRVLRTCAVTAIVAFLVCIIIFLPEAASAGVGFKNLFLILFANFSAAAFVIQVVLYLCRGWLAGRRIVDEAYRLLDWFLGYVLFGFLFLLSFLYFVDKVQGALLFNMKFAKALERSRLLEANYLTSYVDRASERTKKSLKEEVLVEVQPLLAKELAQQAEAAGSSSASSSAPQV